MRKSGRKDRIEAIARFGTARTLGLVGSLVAAGLLFAASPAARPATAVPQDSGFLLE